MRAFPRRVCLLLLLITALAAAFTGAARASEYGNGGGANSGTQNGNIPGGTTWDVWDLRNVSKNLRWGPFENALNAAKAQVAKDCINSQQHNCVLPKSKQLQLSHLLGIDQCGSFSNSRCVLWQDYKESNVNAGYETHDTVWDNGHVSDNGVTGWNIKIWREGVSTPIFSRQVCQYEPNGDTDGYENGAGIAQFWNTRWWTCNGSNWYDARGVSTAGMVESNSPSGNCSWNVNHSGNGVRDLKGRVTSNRKLRVPGAAHPDGWPRDGKATGRDLASQMQDNWCY